VIYLFQPSKYVTHSAGWSSSNAVYRIQEMHGSNLNQISAVFNEVFCGFPQPIPANIRIVSHFWHNCYFLNPFHFIIPLSPHILTLYNVAAGCIINCSVMQVKIFRYWLASRSCCSVTAVSCCVHYALRFLSWQPWRKQPLYYPDSQYCRVGW
jgi:hypothetical protein